MFTRPMLSALVVLLSWQSNDASAISLYQIGNSLTNDSQPPATQKMADAIGLDYEGGWHIRSSSTIRNIWQTPTPTNNNSNPGPTWEDALPNHEWDAIVLQPHNQNGNTMATDLQYAQNFVNYARSEGMNQDMEVYIFSTYPSLSQGWSNWTTPVPNELTQLTIHRRQFYEHVASRLQETIQQPVRIIPTGDVLYRLTQEIALGTVPNMDSVGDLYRDDLHSSNIGRLASSCAVFATITGKSPVGLPTTVYTNGPAETVLRVQQIAWDVVSQHPLSGVVLADGDFNSDGVVDLADYTIWRDHLGAPAGSLSNDPNDTAIGEAQYLTWKQNFSSYASTGVTRGAMLGVSIVPEPTSNTCLLLAIASLLVVTSCNQRQSPSKSTPIIS